MQLPGLSPQVPDIRNHLLAELAAEATQPADSMALLRRAAEGLRDAYGASAAVVGEVVAGDAAGAVSRDGFEVGHAYVLEEAGWHATWPFERERLGFGLLLILPRRGAIAWRTERPRRLVEEDVRFLRTLAFVLDPVLERRAGFDRRAEVRQVERAKREWQAAVDALPQGICLLDKQARVVRINRVLERWGIATLSGSRNAPADRLLALLRPVDIPPNSRCIEMLAHLEPDQEAVWDADFPLMSKRLHMRLIRLPLRELEGEVTAVLIWEDITIQHKADLLLSNYQRELETAVELRTAELAASNARLRAEVAAHEEARVALEASEQRYGRLVEHALVGICLVRDGQITFCNARMGEILGEAVDELTDRPFTLLFGGAAADHQAFAKPGLMEVARADDEPLHLLARQVTVDLMEGPARLWNFVDVTRERKNELALQKLSERLIDAQETERKRVASELHDGIGQTLSAIKIGIRTGLRAAPGDCAGCAVAQAAMERVQGAIDEVRRIALDLRPSMLDDLGLIPTVEWFCREFAQAHPNLMISRQVQAQEQDIPEPLRIVLFRIMQEAARNAAEHAGARRLMIRLERVQDSVRLEVRDDGSGFSPEELVRTNRPGFGLRSMRERAESSGGRLEVETAPGMGTAVVASWCLSLTGCRQPELVV